MIDIDDFSVFNDEHGHHTGDEMLRRTALVLRAALRSCDLVGRWGGEEFLAILPDTDAEGAAIVAERIRHAVEADAFYDVPRFPSGDCGGGRAPPAPGDDQPRRRDGRSPGLAEARRGRPPGRFRALRGEDDREEPRRLRAARGGAAGVRRAPAAALAAILPLLAACATAPPAGASRLSPVRAARPARRAARGGERRPDGDRRPPRRERARAGLARHGDVRGGERRQARAPRRGAREEPRGDAGALRAVADACPAPWPPAPASSTSSSRGSHRRSATSCAS